MQLKNVLFTFLILLSISPSVATAITDNTKKNIKTGLTVFGYTTELVIAGTVLTAIQFKKHDIFNMRTIYSYWCGNDWQNNKKNHINNNEHPALLASLATLASLGFQAPMFASVGHSTHGLYTTLGPVIKAAIHKFKTYKNK